MHQASTTLKEKGITTELSIQKRRTTAEVGTRGRSGIVGLL